MTEQDDRIDKLAAGMAREITPERDLWPDIEATIERQHAPKPQRTAWPGMLAAAAVLMALSSLATYSLMRGSAPDATVTASPAGGASQGTLPYPQSREALAVQAEARLEHLSPATRAVVVGNLAEIRSSIAAINAALADDPGNALLLQLLYSTHRQELGMLREINRLSEIHADGVSI